MAYTKQDASELLGEIHFAVKDILERRGLALTSINATLKDPDLTFTVRTTVPTGSSETVDQVHWNKNPAKIRRLGLSPSDLGKHIPLQGATYRIAGFLPRNTKYPILVELVREEIHPANAKT